MEMSLPYFVHRLSLIFSISQTAIAMSILFAFLWQANIAVAQNPYELSWQKDLPVGLVASGLSLSGTFLEVNTPILTSSEIASLNPNDVNPFDRPTTSRWSPKASDLSDVFLLGTAASPFLLLGDRGARKDWLTIGVMGGEAFLLNYGLTYTFKGGFRRARPFVYNPDAPFPPKVKRNARFSYFSGHASYSAVASFFAARVYLDYHPDSKLKPLIWTLTAALPATTAYLRVRAGKHFPTDVITGYVAGAMVGYFVPILHRKPAKDRALSIYPQIGDRTGILIAYRF